MNRHLIFGLAIVAIAIAFGAMIWQQEMILRQGQTIILETRPYDPRDLFRGEYVILRYQIETEDALRDIAQDADIGTPVYVSLEKDSRGVATFAGVSLRMPDTESDQLWLVGETDRWGVRFPDLEQYYVPEGAGRVIERIEGMHVAISVLDGEVRVSQLLTADLEPIDPVDYIEK